jgi:signal transduction histidine kinase
LRLVTRITIFYVLLSLLVLSIGGFLFYRIFRAEVYEELDEQMRDEKRKIDRVLDAGRSVPLSFSSVNSGIIVTDVSPALKIRLQKKDTLIRSDEEGAIRFRQWRYTHNSESGNKLVLIRRAIIDLGDLSGQLFTAIAAGFTVLFIGIVVLNLLVLRQTLGPFKKALRLLKGYQLGSKGITELPNTDILEFRELNESIRSMTLRIESDYESMRQFSENVSHEIRTPLSIVRNKLELLMQSPRITKDEADLIQSSYEAVTRLSQITQSLILLAKVRNKEYVHDSETDLTRIAMNLAELHAERAAHKSLEIEMKNKASFVHRLESNLATVLLTNLLNNAIRHSEAGGKIVVVSSSQSLSVCNTGKPFGSASESVFQRFYKGGNSSESLGIGLALVRDIAEAANLIVEYEYGNEMHCFIIKKKAK